MSKDKTFLINTLVCFFFFIVLLMAAAGPDVRGYAFAKARGVWAVTLYIANEAVVAVKGEPTGCRKLEWEDLTTEQQYYRMTTAWGQGPGCAVRVRWIGKEPLIFAAD